MDLIHFLQIYIYNLNTTNNMLKLKLGHKKSETKISLF